MDKMQYKKECGKGGGGENRQVSVPGNGAILSDYKAQHEGG